MNINYSFRIISEHLDRNPKYLTEFELPSNIVAVASVSEALENAQVIILALPAQCVPAWLSENRALIDPKCLICNTAKGLYLKEKVLLSEAVRDALGREQPYCVLSGRSTAIPTAKI